MSVVKRDTVSCAEEAAKILVGLAKTPQLRSIRFEFSMDMDGVPIVNYEIERLSFKKDGADDV